MARKQGRPVVCLFGAFVVGLSLALIPTAAVAQSTVAAGGAFTLVVKSDGTVWSFGLNNHGQLGINSLITQKSPVPVPSLSGIQAVAAGSLHSMALTANGALFVWGDNLNGQLGDSTTTDRKTPVLSTVTGVAAIAAGDFHSVALKSNGDLYVWGKNVSGLGDGTTTMSTSPVLILSGVAAIGAGRSHTIAIKADGTAWAWGLNTSKQLGDGTNTSPRTTPVQMSGVSNAVAAWGGNTRTIIRLADGTLMATGENGFGQLGDSTTTDRSTAVPVSGLTEVTQVAAGADHTLAVKSDGSLWAWGEFDHGKLGFVTSADVLVPTRVSSVAGIAQVGAGADHSVAVNSTGVVSTWGINASSQLGDGTILTRPISEAISDVGYAWRVATPTFSVTAGEYTSDRTVVIAVDTAGATIHYTQNGVDPTESDPTIASGASVVVNMSQTLKAKAWKTGVLSSVVGSAAYTLKVVTPIVSPTTGTYTSARTVTMSTTTPGATLRYTTDGSDPTEGSTLYSGSFTVATFTNVKAAGFKAGWSPSAVRSNTYTMNFGTLTAPTISTAAGTYEGQVLVEMFANDPGATVRYTTTGAAPTSSSPAYSSPVVVAISSTVRAKAFNQDYTPSAETSKLYTIRAATPTLSAGSGGYAPGSVVTISTTDASTLHLTLDGSDPLSTSPTVGSGTSMLLGTFTLKVRAIRQNTTDSHVASATYSLTGPLGPGAASAGVSHTVMATTDGRVHSFGENGNGQLGEGSSTDRTTPVLVPTLTGVTALSAGSAFTLARTWDGAVWAWGSNSSGKLGDGTTTQRTRPVRIAGLSNIVSVAAGDSHGLALTADGRVYSWGENSSGQLGLGATVDALTPTEITTLSNIVAIAAGDAHSLALTSGGHLYVWGFNGSSRLGDGTTTTRTSPVLLGLSNIVALAAGAAHNVALQDGGAVYSWGLGSSGQLGNGTTAIKSTPTLVPGLQASAIAAGDNHSAAIRSDGVLVTWGANGSGQLGDGSTTVRSVPTMIATPASVSSLSLGDVHSVAVSPDGSVWTWGDGASGKLGDGALVDRPAPQTVMTGLSDWIPAAPSVSTPSGIYPNAQTVMITSSTPGVVLRYSLDGGEPTAASTEVPGNGEVAIQYSSLFRVRAFAEGRVPGGIARANYQLESDAPSITPGTGVYASAQTVTLAVTGLPAAIRYTIDGSEPTQASPLYSEALVVSSGLTLKARAFPLNGWTASPVSSSTFMFNYGVLEAPAATPAGSTYADAQVITLTAQPDTLIRYTVNGAEPTAASTLYVSPVPVSAGTVVVKARAFRADWTESAVRSESYTIDTTAPTITSYRSPAAFNTWHLTPATVSFICADNLGIASCSAPATISIEGAGQSLIGTAVDLAGRQTELVETINVDLTPPVVTVSAPAVGLVTTDTTLLLTGQVADALSGLAAVSCNGVGTTAVEGEVSCSVALRPGRNDVVLTARDVAGHSTSVGTTVTRVGTATRLTMSPATRTMLVDETATLALRDNFGAAAGSATWTSSHPNIVELSTDDPPVLTAVAPGQALVTATKNGLSDNSLITVVVGIVLEDGTTRLEEGTTRWTVPPDPTPNVRRERSIYPHRIDASGPDLFTVETQDLLAWPTEQKIHAVTASGEVLWMMTAPGLPLMGDMFGGVVGGIENLNNPCRAMYDEFENCYKALMRFGGPEGTMPWRYDSAGYVDRPAIGPDGTLYFIEHKAAPNALSKSLVILDGETGAVTARVPLANLTTLTRVQNQPPPCQTRLIEEEPATVGPIVGGDGFGYLLVTRKSVVTSACSAPDSGEYGMTLLRLSRSGQVSAEVIDQCAGVCDVPRPKQLVPDGIGGLVVVADRYNPPTWNPERSLTMLDGAGGRADTPVSLTTHVDMVGQAGMLYVRTGTGLHAVNVATPTTPIWTAPLESTLLAAKPDGGAFARNAAGDLEDYSATGELSGPTAIGLLDPVPQFESLVGNTAYGIRAIASTISDATRWDAVKRVVGYQQFEQWGYGSTAGNSQVSRPGQGIFAKTHYAAHDYVYGVADWVVRYRHVSIRVVPSDQAYWRGQMGAQFSGQDKFRNGFFTLGAGMGTSDTSTACGGGPLTKGINRTNDVRVPPVDPLERLAFLPSQERVVIERLLARNQAYQNDLPYNCFPEKHPDTYNSNSFAAGLIRAANLRPPRMPQAMFRLFPGWKTPVPLDKFQ